MTMPPKNFIEEKIEEYLRRTDCKNYECGEYHKLNDPKNDCLLDLEWYPESSYEVDRDKVEDFLRSALDQYRDEVRKVGESLKREPTGKFDQMTVKYNQALTDFLSHPLLSKTKE